MNLIMNQSPSLNLPAQCWVEVDQCNMVPAFAWFKTYQGEISPMWELLQYSLECDDNRSGLWGGGRWGEPVLECLPWEETTHLRETLHKHK